MVSFEERREKEKKTRRGRERKKKRKNDLEYASSPSNSKRATHSMSLLMPRSNPVPQSIIITLHSRSNSRSSHISSSKRSRVVLVRIEVGSSVSREGRRSSNSSRVSVNGSVEDLLVSVLLGVEGSSSSDLGGFDCSESASGGSVVEGGVVGSVVVVVVVVKVGRDGVVVVGLRVRAVVIVNMRGVVGVRVLGDNEEQEKEMSERNEIERRVDDSKLT